MPLHDISVRNENTDGLGKTYMQPILTSNPWVVSSAGLQMPIHAQFYRPTIWTSKVGQGDLVFDVRSGFASGCVRARLQVSVYSGYTTYAALVVPKLIRRPTF